VAIDCHTYSEKRRNSSSATTQQRGKTHLPMPSYKRPRGSISQSSHDIHRSFGDNGSRGASGSKLTLRHLKDAKGDFKSPLKSYNSNEK